MSKKVDISRRYAFWSGQTDSFLSNTNAKTGKVHKWKWREWTPGQVLMFEEADVEFFTDMIEAKGSKKVKASPHMRIFREYLVDCKDGDNWDNAFNGGGSDSIFMGVPLTDGEPDFTRAVAI
jgi:hypothetical protein